MRSKFCFSHSPELYQQAAAEGIQLYLTGHTHAGQIRLPGIGALKHNAHCPRRMGLARGGIAACKATLRPA